MMLAEVTEELKIIAGTQEDRDLIQEKIMVFNSKQVPFTQDEYFIYLNYMVKDNEVLIAGINAVLYCWKCLYINLLWVDEKYRGLSLGSKLLQKVESEAKGKGSTLAHVDTFDFQAKGFYLKHGYQVFGELEGCPPGHKQFALKKNL